MSTDFKEFSEVPTKALSSRLAYLSDVFARKKGNVSHEITMRVPAELDRDADLVCANAAVRLSELSSKVDKLKAENVVMRDALEGISSRQGASLDGSMAEKALNATPQHSKGAEGNSRC